MANRNVARINRVCEYCQSEFDVAPSVVKAGHGQFCSRPCRDLANHAERTIRTCICGKTFEVLPSNLKRGGKVCSIKCRAQKNSRPTVERFWKKVEKTDTCWLWTGARYQSGYGVFRVKGHNVPAHRFILEVGQGKPLPPTFQACHKCDNPPCVRPDHLFAGTRIDNMQDCAKKGRQNSKLTPEKVRDIRQRYAIGDSLVSLASKHQVHTTTIRHALKRKYWKHVD